MCYIRMNIFSLPKDAYESIKPEFRIELKDEQIKALKYFCDGLQIDKLDMLIECLFECLMLRLTISQNKEDEDYVDVQRMRYSTIIHFN